MKKFANTSRMRMNKNFASFLCLLLALNLTHNFKVSNENRSREFQYEAWQTLTKSESFFAEVKTSDIFISSNQNDAFETNAGSFYANSGKRLAYMFNTNIIWPDITQCRMTVECELASVRKKSISTIPNLTRGTFVPKLLATNRIDDWVGINSKENALSKSTIWAFDMFLITSTTYFSYLVPFLNNENQAQVDFLNLQVATVTKLLENEFRPAIANVCLEQVGNGQRQSGQLMTVWRVPKLSSDPSGAPIKSPEKLDFKQIQAGTCVIK
jgi:hypothetical protein